MRCKACNRLFYPKLTYKSSTPSFSKYCNSCITSRGESYSDSYDFFYSREDHPLVRIAKGYTISTEQLF